MRTTMILLSFLVMGLAIGWLISYFSPQIWPQYTAETFIRVLPGTDKGWTVNRLRHQSTLSSLIDGGKIQQTEWFQGLGKIKDERLKAGVPDLKRRSCARAIPNSDLIRVSMTCANGDDAAVIVNEMVDMFLKIQLGAKRKQIASNLVFLDDNQVRLQRDLDLAGRTLDDVRRRYGFADLEEHTYPHPVTARLIRLQGEEDNCALDINQLQTRRDALLSQPSPGKPDPNTTAGIKDLELKIKLVQNRFAGLGKMREETEKKQEELDLARTQYARGQFIRDNRRAALDSVRAKIEELGMLSDNPEITGLQLVDSAPTLLQADILPWQIPVPIAGGAGLLLGIICVLLTNKKKKINP
jgi:hypothetical protein